MDFSLHFTEYLFQKLLKNNIIDNAVYFTLAYKLIKIIEIYYLKQEFRDKNVVINFLGQILSNFLKEFSYYVIELENQQLSSLE